MSCGHTTVTIPQLVRLANKSTQTRVETVSSLSINGKDEDDHRQIHQPLAKDICEHIHMRNERFVYSLE